MRIPSIRSRTLTAVAMSGIGMAALAACAPASDTATARQPAAVTAATSVPVVVDCAEHAQTRPGQYTLACAAGSAYLAGLHWAAWGPAAAFADGVSTFNDCTPSCVAGHGHSFPVLVTLWRAEPLPGHAGTRYFTRLTVIYTGSRTYHAGGTLRHVPETVTYPLSSSGGA